MSVDVLMVVGDTYVAFADSKPAMTLSETVAMLDGDKPAPQGVGRILLIPGQGLGDDDIETVLDCAADSPLRDRLVLTEWRRTPKRAERRLSHKHNTENTLISAPRRVAENLFELQLLIDERCELMRDHQTGQHVQGMILVEAARQSIVAVTEAYYNDDSDGLAFIFDDLSVKFEAFAFPIGTTIRYRVTEASGKPARRKYQAEVEIVQCGTRVASLDLAYSTADKSRIARQEELLAKKAAERYAAELGFGASPVQPARPAQPQAVPEAA